MRAKQKELGSGQQNCVGPTGLITTQDIGQEGSRKAGKLEGLGPTVIKARGHLGARSELTAHCRPHKEFGWYAGWDLGRGMEEPGTHWAASTAGCGQEGLGEGPGKTVWERPGLLAKSPSHVLQP